MLNTFGMADAQKAGEFVGEGKVGCGVAYGILSVFKGLSLAAPLLGRTALAAPKGPVWWGETRAFETVSRNFWRMIGGAEHMGITWGLDHYAVTQAASAAAGQAPLASNWALLALPRFVNSYMNGQASTMWLRSAITAAVPASLASGAALGGWAGLTTTSCGCK
jgi:hypothetical protein